MAAPEAGVDPASPPPPPRRGAPPLRARDLLASDGADDPLEAAGVAGPSGAPGDRSRAPRPDAGPGGAPEPAELLVAFDGSTISLPSFAHPDASEDPPEPGRTTDEMAIIAPPRQRPSITSASLRLPGKPLALTPLFGGSREAVTEATVGFDFGGEPALGEAALPVGRRTVPPWLSRPLLDLTRPEPAASGADTDRQRRMRLALVGLAATVLPTLGLVAVARHGDDAAVTSAAGALTSETVSVRPGRPPSPAAEPVAATIDPPTTSTTQAPTTTAPPTTAPPTTAPPTTRPRPVTTPPQDQTLYHETGSGSPTQAQLDFLACTRRIESTNNYRAVDPSGTYFGAYQFDQPTWNGVVARLGRSDLVGVRPSNASPADQDAAALQLFKERGAQPWGGRCA